jgi:hypothetical protein
MKLIFLCIALAICWQRTEADPVCTATVDVGFVIDSSGSITRYYQKEKDFVKSLADAFGIKKGQAHSGVVRFSATADLQIRFNQYYDSASFNKAVDRIGLLGSVTRIDLAFNLAREQLFNPKFGARTNVPKLLIFITDGVHTTRYRCGRIVTRTFRRRGRTFTKRFYASAAEARKICKSGDPVKAAKAAAASGIKVIVVGVGNKRAINKRQLLTYAKDVYTAGNFKELLTKKFIDQITNKMCSKEFIHECDTKKKGGCSQLCHKEGKKFKCDCEVGYALDKDGKSCFKDHMEKCRHGKVLVKLGCFLQLVAPLCEEKQIVNLRGLYKGKWSPPAAAKKVAQEIVCKCSGLAFKRKHLYFSIRNSGECLTGSPDQPTRLKLSYFNKLLHSSPDKCFAADGKFDVCDDTSANMCIGGPNHDYVYLLKDHCSVNNGGCSHHCDDIPYGVECKCRYGYVLLKDQKTCKRNAYSGGPVIIG